MTSEEEESEYLDDESEEFEEEHKEDYNNAVQMMPLPSAFDFPTTRIASSLTKKKPTCQTILHKNLMIVFGAEIIDRDTNQILVYNLNNQEWKTIIPKGNLEVALNLEYSVCKVSSTKIIIYGAPKKAIIEPDLLVRDQTCCQILNIVEMQNMDKTDTSIPDLVGAEWELAKMFSYEFPYFADAAVNVFENKLYVYGGKDKGGSINGYLYTVDLKTFKVQLHNPSQSTANLMYLQSEEYLEPRHKLSGTVYNGKIYYYGGFGEYSKSLFDMWRLDTRTLEWKLIRKTILWPYLVVDWFTRCEEDRIIFLGGSPHTLENQNSEIITYKISDDSYNFNSLTTIIGTGVWETNKSQFEFSSGPNTIFEIYKNNIIYGEPLNLNQIPLNQTEPKFIKENNNFCKSDRKLFEEKLYSDVSFKIGDTIIQAHRALLITRCQYFYNLFESKQLIMTYKFDKIIESNSEIIEIEDIKAHIFNGLLEYLYCGDIQKLSEDVCVELLKLAGKHVIPGLKKYCEQFLLHKLRVENVVDFTNLADAYEAKALNESGVQFIATKFEDIFKKQDIKQLSNSNLLRVFQLFKTNKSY